MRAGSSGNAVAIEAGGAGARIAVAHGTRGRTLAEQRRVNVRTHVRSIEPCSEALRPYSSFERSGIRRFGGGRPMFTPFRVY